MNAGEREEGGKSAQKQAWRALLGDCTESLEGGWRRLPCSHWGGREGGQLGRLDKEAGWPKKLELWRGRELFRELA